MFGASILLFNLSLLFSPLNLTESSRGEWQCQFRDAAGEKVLHTIRQVFKIKINESHLPMDKYATSRRSAMANSEEEEIIDPSCSSSLSVSSEICLNSCYTERELNQRGHSLKRK